MKIPVFCAGALEVRWSSFLCVLIAARLIRYFTLAYLAQRYGLGTLEFLRTHALEAALIALALAAATLLILRLARSGEVSDTPGL